MAESMSVRSSENTATPDASVSISLGNLMLPAADTKEVMQDRVSATDYRISLVLMGSRLPRADAALL